MLPEWETLVKFAIFFSSVSSPGFISRLKTSYGNDISATTSASKITRTFLNHEDKNNEVENDCCVIPKLVIIFESNDN